MSSSGIHVFFHLRSFQDWIEKWEKYKMQRDQIKWLFTGEMCTATPDMWQQSSELCSKKFPKHFPHHCADSCTLKFSSFLCAVPSLPLISSFWWSSINLVPQKQPMTTLFINGHFMGLEMSSNLQSKELTAKPFFNMWCKIVEIRYGGSIDFLLDKVARASRWVWPAPS